MMHFPLRWLAIILAGVTSSAVQAEVARAQLTIDGVIRPPACNPVLSVPMGVVDYGTIALSSLNRGAKTTLSVKDVVLTITCSDATKLSIEVIDNRADSRPAGTDNSYFGLGKVNNRAVGAYMLNVSTLKGDGNATRIVWTTDQGANWGSAVSGYLWARFPYSWGQQSPVAYRVFNMTLGVKAVIEPRESLPAGDDIPLDGSSTLQFSYL